MSSLNSDMLEFCTDLARTFMAAGISYFTREGDSKVLQLTSLRSGMNHSEQQRKEIAEKTKSTGTSEAMHSW